MKYIGIKSNDTVKNWYCKKCNKAMNILYISQSRNHYCDDCLPLDVDKTKIKMINQNRESI